ncbi:capsid decoration protein [Arthrobacter phage HumptyDumpty]|uniref:Capsid decoration protein n=8 Tax=Klausavirus princesstrina TaxID=1984784 RepID=A0A286N424_9CAUD|nr:capsid decoration protein [Arthrobacter phage Conboy]APC44695.1 capsid decoration protein [Arthrobacter phage EdgarPoe]APC44806.1 capsid decoration protein [Arthrobacter phage HumptyDumpty]ASX98796.1 capsid decoration protein [Arthrobacter phage Kabreeze]ASX99019.1 capsid decoration protein [Arthrobacter phage Scavito]ASX99131.1 capsid decoration protein [Arthrobacter phage Tophat]QBP30382.1 capsid decoration protein [Arthrobacter phage Chipper1996]QEQ94117.1 capsid decoration protein [Ar
MGKYQSPTDIVRDPAKNYTAKATGAAVRGSRFVSFVAGGNRETPNAAEATATSAIVGVSKYDAAQNETFGIIKGGQAGVIAGGAVAAGDRVVSDAQGRAVKAADGAPYVGVAYTDAALNAVVYIDF